MLNRRQFTFFGAALSAFAQSPQPPQTTPPAQVQPQIDWHDIRRFTLEGLAYADRKAPYDRLPARAEGVVPPQVWGLSHHSAGALVRFNADTPLLRARWTRLHKGLAGTNMTAIAASGLRQSGTNAAPSISATSFTTSVCMRPLPETNGEKDVVITLGSPATDRIESVIQLDLDGPAKPAA